MFYNSSQYSTNVSTAYNSIYPEEIDLKGFTYIPPEDVEFLMNSTIGNGSFGYVKKARWKGQIVAAKFQNTKQFQIEAEQLAKIKHANIITVFGYTMHSDNHVIVMEFAEGGSLGAVLTDPEYQIIHYTLSHAISWCLQCARGVLYLHSMKPKPLIHRDLKPLNLLLNHDGLVLKICDFGTACDKKTEMTNNKGSSAWMAPEVFKGNNYSEKCDVFSWALILWQCLSRKQPFNGFENDYAIQWAKVMLRKKPPMLRGCPSKLRNLLTNCWDENPDVRFPMKDIVPIMEEILTHCSVANLYPLNLAPNSSVKEGRVFITNVLSNMTSNNNRLPGSINSGTNNSNSFIRRISDDNLISRDSFEHRQTLGHKRSSSSDASLLLDCLPNRGGSSNSVSSNTGCTLSATDEVHEIEDETQQLLRNFNAYLVLEERHYPVQPDIKNSESIDLFESHRQLSVKLLRLTFEIARLEAYENDLKKWETDPTRDDAVIYMRFCDENHNLKKLRTDFVEQLKQMHNAANVRTTNASLSSLTTSIAVPEQRRDSFGTSQPSIEVGDWVMVGRPNDSN